MSSGPLAAMGRRRGLETVIEVSLPGAFALGAWGLALVTLSRPTAARVVSPIELLVLLGACVALTGWMAGRQSAIARRKSAYSALLLAVVYTLVGLLLLAPLVQNRFTNTCADTRNGDVIALASPILPTQRAKACRVGGVPDNPYLPGVFLRPTWDGSLHPVMWALLLLISAVSSLGLRNRRLFRSRLALGAVSAMRFASAAGTAAGVTPPALEPGAITACANPTLWGEPCGQLYSAERHFAPGEPCVRCGQTFRPCGRQLTFHIVSLFTAELDTLNGLERTDTVSWDRGDPISPDARISGVERWVLLGTITLPDVITVATALALVHQQLSALDGASPAVERAAALAGERASRVSAWLWWGRLSHRLTYARPTEKVRLALGPTRLRDLVPEGGEQLWLQLDLGLLPLEVRYGFRKRFADNSRPPQEQNSKTDLWILTAPPAARDGLWMPRIEGAALRAWLSTERLRENSEQGGSIPLPYLPFTRAEEPAPTTDPYAGRAPKAGTLDFVRQPLAWDGSEPLPEHAVGCSVTEWAWLEWEQIELLRQECLVLTERSGGA